MTTGGAKQEAVASHTNSEISQTCDIAQDNISDLVIYLLRDKDINHPVESI